MEEQEKKEKFNEILKKCIENNDQHKLELNEDSKNLLDKTIKVLDVIENNWNDLKTQREQSNPSLTAEEWAEAKINVKKSE